MSYRRLNKSQKELIEVLKNRQVSALNSLRLTLSSLIKKSQDLERKVQEKGIETNYSASSDIIHLASTVYRQELTLSTLRTAQQEIEYEFNRKPKVKEK